MKNITITCIHDDDKHDYGKYEVVWDYHKGRWRYKCNKCGKIIEVERNE